MKEKPIEAWSTNVIVRRGEKTAVVHQFRGGNETDKKYHALGERATAFTQGRRLSQ
jgi:hypothetical protein